jgi:glutathione S-transferase
VSDSLPILYSFRRCPYAMRARLALAVSGQAFTLREIDLRNRPDEIYAASAKGTVPVFVLPDGKVIDESLDLMRWALSQSDPEAWLPSSPEVLADTTQLIARNDGEFKHHLDRYKYAARYEGVDAIEHRGAASLILRELDARLRKHACLIDAQFRLADAALAPFVRQFAIADRAWFDAQDCVALRNWLDRFIASKRFQLVMQKYPVWQAGQDPLLVNWK